MYISFLMRPLLATKGSYLFWTVQDHTNFGVTTLIKRKSEVLVAMKKAADFF